MMGFRGTTDLVPFERLWARFFDVLDPGLGDQSNKHTMRGELPDELPVLHC